MRISCLRLLQASVPVCLRRSAAAGLASGQASLQPLHPSMGLPSDCSPPCTLGLSLQVWGQTAGSSGLYKVTRRLALSRAEPRIPAWLWAHRICQQPSSGARPQPTPPAHMGHYLPHLPRPPNLKFIPFPSYHIPFKPVLRLLPLVPLPQIPLSSYSVLQRPGYAHSGSRSSLAPTCP